MATIKQRHELCLDISDIVKHEIGNPPVLQDYGPLYVGNEFYNKEKSKLIALLHDLTTVTPNDTQLGELVRTMFS